MGKSSTCIEIKRHKWTKESIKELSDFILEYTGFKKIKHTWEHGILKAK